MRGTSRRRVGLEDCKRLWQILSRQFNATIEDELIDKLIEAFGCLPGRDIKGLVKLVSKFTRKRNLPYTVDAFRACAQFRGLV